MLHSSSASEKTDKSFFGAIILKYTEAENGVYNVKKDEVSRERIFGYLIKTKRCELMTFVLTVRVSIECFAYIDQGRIVRDINQGWYRYILGGRWILIDVINQRSK